MLNFECFLRGCLEFLYSVLQCFEIIHQPQPQASRSRPSCEGTSAMIAIPINEEVRGVDMAASFHCTPLRPQAYMASDLSGWRSEV